MSHAVNIFAWLVNVQGFVDGFDLSSDPSESAVSNGTRRTKNTGKDHDKDEEAGPPKSTALAAALV